jgi:hypothetical protein
MTLLAIVVSCVLLRFGFSKVVKFLLQKAPCGSLVDFNEARKSTLAVLFCMLAVGYRFANMHSKSHEKYKV